MLDTSRIEWADLKNTDESFEKHTVSQYIALAPKISVDMLTHFPLVDSLHFSPADFDASRLYKLVFYVYLFNW